MKIEFCAGRVLTEKVVFSRNSISPSFLPVLGGCLGFRGFRRAEWSVSGSKSVVKFVTKTKRAIPLLIVRDFESHVVSHTS